MVGVDPLLLISRRKDRAVRLATVRLRLVLRLLDPALGAVRQRGTVGEVEALKVGLASVRGAIGTVRGIEKGIEAGIGTRTGEVN